MAAPAPGTDPNPLHIQWKNPECLAFLGAQKGAAPGVPVLDASNVMEYFSTSPFYDRRCNNEHVRMQSAALIAQTMATTPAHSGEEFLRALAQRHEEELRYARALTQALYRPRVCGRACAAARLLCDP